MKQITYLCIGILLVFVFSSSLFSDNEEIENTKNVKNELPKVGSIYKYSKAEWYVRGVGDKPFEYKSTGESICVIVIGISGAIVKATKKDELVKIDPGIPMIFINNIEDKQLKANTYFMRKAKNKVFILLEYKR